MRGRRGSAWRWIGLALVGLAGCGPAPPPPDKLLVVATIYPLYDFTRQIAGDEARVMTLVPPGVEPHDWEPSPQEMAELHKARLFVYNGAGLEPWADRLAADAAARGGRTVKATEGIPLLAGATGRERAAPDPHVWLDPVLAQAMVENIRSGLAQVDPAHAAGYAERARAFSAAIQRLHAAFAAGLAQCVRREIVVSHGAFGYLARRYRLAMVPVMGLAPEAEPSPAELAALARFARERKVKYIFFETLVSPRLAETLAREVGARTLVLDPVEGVTKEEAAAGKGYLALMEANLRNLRTALDCR
jgi:zinc transport system substrate-binding protein